MPDPEFRPIPSDRLDEYSRIVDYAFNPSEGPGDSDDPDEVADRLGDRFGVFVGDDLRSVCKHYDFEARLRDTWVPLAGLAAVATPPEHRRQGYVTRSIEASLERWRGEFPLSALWPFDRPFYRRFDWATANTTAKYTCSPDALSFARGETTEEESTTGRFRRVTADDWRALQDVHESHATDRTLTLRRDEAWWSERVLGTLDDDDRRHAYAWERDGEARGYLVYEVERTGGGIADRRIEVSDLAFIDHEARLALLRFVADHDSQVDEVVHYHEDESLLDFAVDPGDINCEVRAGPMVRVVDVAHALSTVPYPDDATADLTLAIGDPTVPWNDGTFRLRVADGDGECVPVDVAPAGADVTVDVGTLSQLVVGAQAVETLCERGEIEAADGPATELAGVFPATTVYLRQFF